MCSSFPNFAGAAFQRHCCARCSIIPISRTFACFYSPHATLTIFTRSSGSDRWLTPNAGWPFRIQSPTRGPSDDRATFAHVHPSDLPRTLVIPWRNSVPNDPLRAQLSRRQLLKRAGLVGAAAMATPIGTLVPSPAVAQSAAQGQSAIGRGRVWETLSGAEAETLEAITARLIPSDANGPGALEAQAARYIDRALGGALAFSHDAYRSGLAAIDGYARMSKGSPFAKLSAADQDAILRDMEANVASGFVPDAATFFNLVRAHTIQGTFCD